MRRAPLLLLVAACGGAAPDQPPAVAPPPPPPVAASAELALAPVESVAPPAPPATLEERAARLHHDSIVIDTHDDITSRILEDGFDLGKPARDALAAKGGKTAATLPAFVKKLAAPVKKTPAH